MEGRDPVIGPGREEPTAGAGDPSLTEGSGMPAMARARSGAEPIPHPRAADLQRLDRLADLLDSRYRVPVVGWRFGLDAILGLLPGIGDLAALGPAAYLVWEGRRLGASKGTLGRMAVNTAVDFAVGTVPVAGTVFDVFFKANRRNIELLKADVARRPPPAGGPFSAR